MKWEEKTPTFLSASPKYGLRFVKKLCTHVQVLGVAAMVKNERQGAMWAIVGRIFYCPLLNSKSPLICIVGKQQKNHKPRSLNYCFFANQRVLFFEMPFLPYKGFVLTGHLKTAKLCECLWSSAEHIAEAVTCRGKNIFIPQQKSSNLYIIMFQVSENVSE